MARLFQSALLLFIFSFSYADLYCSQNWYGGCDDRGCGGRCQRVGLGDCVCGAGLGVGTYGSYGAYGLPAQPPIVPALTTSGEGSAWGCVSSGYSGCTNNGGCRGRCFNAGIVPNNVCQCQTNSFPGYVNRGLSYGGSTTGGCVSQGINGCVSEGCLGRCVNSGIPPNNICYCEYGYGNGFGLGRK
uniref:Uncharacterized protein n=1 Tax=Plectus sambesii TaxID=2011161 RepID=A0A914VID2_9BILA